MRNSKGQIATRTRLLTCGATVAIVTACAFAVPVMAQDAAATTTTTSADETTTVVVTNDNRSVEFDQYPSELISQVLVYKTPNAGMTDQGIAGTADRASAGLWQARPRRQCARRTEQRRRPHRRNEEYRQPFLGDLYRSVLQ